MEQFILTLQEEMNGSLKKVSADADNVLIKAEQSYYSVQGILKKLKEFIIDYAFKDEEEEVRFFKDIKPVFQSELIYHHEIYNIESNKPFGNKANLREFYTKELNGIDKFHERNKDVFNYYQTRKINNDKEYFLRKMPPAFIDEDALEIDDRFCTPISCKLARFKAYERLLKYLNHAFISIDNVIGEPVELSLLKWTDPKSALIELGYGLFCKASLNNGQATIKQIIAVLEYMFSIDLGNWPTVFNQNIRLRKMISPTEYLDSLPVSLKKYIDHWDGR